MWFFVVLGAMAYGTIVFFGFLGGSNVDAVAVGTNTSDADCRAACEQVQVRRSDLCIASTAARAAQAEADRAATAHAATLVTLGLATAAAGAAWAAAAVPVVGLAATPAAVAASVVFGLALAAEAVAFGIMLGAQLAARRASDAEVLARRREQEAIQILRSKCSPADVDACLARPRPC
jgi:hypothetical protein